MLSLMDIPGISSTVEVAMSESGHLCQQTMATPATVACLVVTSI